MVGDLSILILSVLLFPKLKRKWVKFEQSRYSVYYERYRIPALVSIACMLIYTFTFMWVISMGWMIYHLFRKKTANKRRMPTMLFSSIWGLSALLMFSRYLHTGLLEISLLALGFTLFAAFVFNGFNKYDRYKFLFIDQHGNVSATLQINRGLFAGWYVALDPVENSAADFELFAPDDIFGNYLLIKIDRLSKGSGLTLENEYFWSGIDAKIASGSQYHRSRAAGFAP